MLALACVVDLALPLPVLVQSATFCVRKNVCTLRKIFPSTSFLHQAT
jgi:hypothetical protein